MTTTTRAGAHQRHESPGPLVSSSTPDSPARTSSNSGSRERPIRKKLQKTSLAGPQDLPEPTVTEQTLEPHEIVTSVAPTDQDHAEAILPTENGVRGRVRRKRSFEDLGGELVENAVAKSATKHVRKRSRDSPSCERKENDGPQTPVEEAPKTEGAAEPVESTVVIQDVDPVTTTIERPKKSVAVQDVDPGPTAIERPKTPVAVPNLSDDNSIESHPSPQKKRSRDQFDHDHQQECQPEVNETAGLKPSAETEEDSSASAGNPKPEQEPELKRPRDDPPPLLVEEPIPPAAKIPLSGGFADNSIESPSNVQAGSASLLTQSQSSSSAFAASGFALLAGSASSPFATLAAPSPSKPHDEVPKTDKPPAFHSTTPTGGFGSLGGTGLSSFGSGSGFGSLGAGFGSGTIFGGGAPLTSFASPQKFTASSSKGSKTFDTPTDEDAEEGEIDGDDDLEANAVGFTEDSLKDDRFFEQDVETGEENEVIVFQSRAKLYMSVDKQWKERGVGNFKVNATTRGNDPDQEDAPRKKTARFLMRADGSHRIVLNSPLRKEIKVEDPTGGPPKGKTAVFLGFIDDKPTMLQLKMRSKIQTEELHKIVVHLQEGM